MLVKELQQNSNSVLPGWRFDQPGKQHAQKAAGDEGGYTDEWQKSNAQVSKTHDPHRGHKGDGQEKQQPSLLQQLAKIGNRQRQINAALLGQKTEKIAGKESRYDKGE